MVLSIKLTSDNSVKQFTYREWCGLVGPLLFGLYEEPLLYTRADNE